MAVRRLADEQPADFTFTPENLDWAKKRIADYPEGRQASAVLPILRRAQDQHRGWLPAPPVSGGSLKRVPEHLEHRF